MYFGNWLRCSVRCISRAAMAETKPVKKKQFRVFVEGNIGSGKTTFLNHFINDNVQILSEPVELWRNVQGHNLLGLMYEDPLRWGLTFQTYVQLTMVDLHTRQSDHPVKIMERSIFSARYCFVENLVKQDVMSAAEFVVLDEWFKWITSHLDVSGDLIVYLRTDPEVVYERVKARSRKEETCIPLEYLQKLHELHEDWLYYRRSFSLPAPVIMLDANRSLPEMEKEYEKCKSLIFKNDTKVQDMNVETSLLT